MVAFINRVNVSGVLTPQIRAWWQQRLDFRDFYKQLRTSASVETEIE